MESAKFRTVETFGASDVLGVSDGRREFVEPVNSEHPEQSANAKYSVDAVNDDNPEDTVNPKYAVNPEVREEPGVREERSLLGGNEELGRCGVTRRT